MQKNTEIYVIFHRPVEYGMPNDDLYTPLQVGTECNGMIDFYGGHHDNEGRDNISIWNPLFVENTGLYWIWKHLTASPRNDERPTPDGQTAKGLTPDGRTPAECSKILNAREMMNARDFTGFCQYRRRLDFHNEKELDFIFQQHDVIAAQPIFLIGSLHLQYAACHNAHDIDLAEKIVKELYPDYAEDWDRHINNGRTLFYSNGFIMRTPDFIKYCEWLFSILFEFKNRMDWKTPEDHKKYIDGQMAKGLRPKNNGKGGTDGADFYQGEIFGFLSERLWTLYLLHNFKKERIFITPYVKYENV